MKRVIAAVISMVIVTLGCLSVSAQEVNFGGATSGGSLGSTDIVARISTTDRSAYLVQAGFNTPDISGSFTMDIVGHLYVISNPMGSYHKIVDCPITTPGGGLPVSVQFCGTESNYPPNGCSGYNYEKVVVTIDYNSANHGSWSGSGQMDY